MNGKITLSISIAFLICFSLFFILYSFSPDIHTDRKNHSFYNEKFDTDKKIFFIMGSSHVGQLNTTHIVNHIHSFYPQYDVYNLAVNADKPKERFEDVEKIIALSPTIIFYGISYRDFSSSFDEPVPYSIQAITKTFYDFEVDSINPKFVTLKFLRNILGDSNSSKDPKFSRINTPFNELGVRQTEIISDKELILQSESRRVKDTKIIIENNEQVIFLKKFLEKMEENKIKVVLFSTPLNKHYIENLPISTKNSFELILDEISSDFDLQIYDYSNKYRELDLWQNLGHVAYNTNSLIFSIDVAKMIEKEIDS